MSLRAEIDAHRPRRDRHPRPLLWGTLVAVFCPVQLFAFVALLGSWKEAIPTADTPLSAMVQAITYLPGLILVSLIAAIFTAPSIVVWVLLRRRGWAPWYLCAGVGTLTGWAIAFFFTNANDHTATYAVMHQRMEFEMAVAGLLTGLLVWAVARDRGHTIEHQGKQKAIPGARAYVEGQGQNAQPADLSTVPDAIREVVKAAQQLGYRVETVARSTGALVVHMRGPLRPEDREVLIQQFPDLERWFYSGSPHNPPDEGFRDAVTGAAISFPAWMVGAG